MPAEAAAEQLSLFDFMGSGAESREKRERLEAAVEDLRRHGISPVYLVTDHTGYYEQYGWEFLCLVQGDGEPDLTRMYIHR